MWPVDGTVQQQDLGPERTGRDRPMRAWPTASRPAESGDDASQIAIGPSPWRARVAASRPSVEGSMRMSAGHADDPRPEQPAVRPEQLVHAEVRRRVTEPG